MDEQEAQKYVGERVSTISVNENSVEITFEDGSTLFVGGRGGDGHLWVEVQGT